ncbi:Wzz/FepE/Etk N-terminal domain-containing protein [Algoriphagus sp. D3-2-R+10]|uniref:Wzz/FepE/Etk N-terminal domain-containing protein n=1 Tax=Algoriphagus aurantiacus TaxID=3103948 RepID=UPI002B37F647|nr:Wzz/FepE/Etk N-terminal domain-containing protein [Algoriphagus sp. D3-2-R+10]MEB2777504.1 Wzz/FepE/Etk N-terminal domain-containing protein [Algoriphagus sp. D3-2-R+10]
MNKKTEKILAQNDFTIVNLTRLIRMKLHLLIGTIVLFMLMGYVYYSTTPDSYVSTSVLLVEAQNSSSSGGLGSLAQVAGISVPGNADPINTLDPALYPLILQSKPFLEELMNTKVKSNQYQDSVSLFKYMVEVRPQNSIYKVLKRPSTIISSPLKIDDSQINEARGKNRVQYNPFELYALGQIGQRILATSEGRLLTITTEMPEAELSFQFSRLVEKLLIEYATKYLIEKQEAQVEYLDAQFLKSEIGFKDAQSTLANFKERNQGLFSESLKAYEQNLNAEYSLKFELFRTIAQELELAKIKLNSQKPIFTSIEPSYIALSPASPKLMLTVVFMLVLGFIFGLILIFVIYTRNYFQIHQGENP